MAGNAFDRTIINARERARSSDHNSMQAEVDRSLREVLGRCFGGRVGAANDLTAVPLSGFLGDAFKVRPPAAPGLSVTVTSGLGFQYLPGAAQAGIGGVSGLDDLSVIKPLPLLASQSLNVPAGPSAGQDRTDIIEVRMNRVIGDPLARDVLDTLTAIFATALVDKSLTFTLDGDVGQVISPASSTAAISYKQGSPVSTGAFNPANVPDTTPGYVKIATIFSSNGNMVANVSKANIIDERALLTSYGQRTFHVAGTVPSGASSPPTVTDFDAPPGVEVLISKVAAPAQNRIKVWIVGNLGGITPQVVAGGEVLSAYSGAGFDVLTLIAVSSGTLSSGNVATLADATITANAQVLAEGSRYVSAEFGGLHQGSGTTNASVPDPMTFTATISS